MDWISTGLQALADPVRLRALRVLWRHELTSGEVAQVLGVTPSTASKHLAHLREAGMTSERRDGRHVHVAVAPSARSDPRWAPILEAAAAEHDGHGDDARLDDVLRSRRESRDGSATRTFVPGRSWAAWARAVATLAPPGLRAADLGCGDGALTIEVARFAESVVGIDRRESCVRAARALADRRGVTNVRFETGDAADPPIPASSCGLVLISQVLHASRDPAAVLAGARRIARPGARLLVLDLLPHAEDWVRERLGHERLGFAPKELGDLVRRAGFRDVVVERAPGRTGDPFRVVIASGVRPSKEGR